MTIFAISGTHNGTTRTPSVSSHRVINIHDDWIETLGQFSQFQTAALERNFLRHCTSGGISYAYLICFYYNNAGIQNNLRFNAFNLKFQLHFHILNLWLCNSAPLKLIPRNLISSLNSLTCFRIVDDNLIANKPKNFEAFVTCQEGTP